jgi:hypothetical protein
MKIIFWFYTVVASVVTVWRIVLFFLGKKYAWELANLPEEKRKRLLTSNRVIIKAIRLFLWLSLVYVILVPLAVYFVGAWDWVIYAAVVMILLYVMAVPIYLERKWLVRFFEQNQM